MCFNKISFLLRIIYLKWMIIFKNNKRQQREICLLVTLLNIVTNHRYYLLVDISNHGLEL